MVALCRLDTIRLPHSLFIQREALSSMKIYGSDSVSDYVAALEYGLSRVRSGFPVSNALLKDVHRLLLASAWRSIAPGEFRDLQNWVGGTLAEKARFVPPPPSHVEGCMTALEEFMLAPSPLLIKAALVHAQFHTIHPFFKGSGRVGRMLIPLMTHPLLHMSQYFLDRLSDYHRLLDLVRAQGDWESWLDFFLLGVDQAASYTACSARLLAALFEADIRRVRAVSRGASSARRVLQAMCAQPITSLRFICEGTGLQFPTAARGMDRLRKLGIVRERSHGRRYRVFAYQRCVEILDG